MDHEITPKFESFAIILLNFLINIDCNRSSREPDEHESSEVSFCFLSRLWCRKLCKSLWVSIRSCDASSCADLVPIFVQTSVLGKGGTRSSSRQCGPKSDWKKVSINWILEVHARFSHFSLCCSSKFLITAIEITGKWSNVVVVHHVHLVRLVVGKWFAASKINSINLK